MGTTAMKSDLASLLQYYADAAIATAIHTSLTEKLYHQYFQECNVDDIAGNDTWSDLRVGLKKLMSEQCSVAGHIEACRGIATSLFELPLRESPSVGVGVMIREGDFPTHQQNPLPSDVEVTVPGPSSLKQGPPFPKGTIRTYSRKRPCPSHTATAPLCKVEIDNNSSSISAPQKETCPACLLPFTSVASHAPFCTAEKPRDEIVQCESCCNAVLSSKMAQHKLKCRQERETRDLDVNLAQPQRDRCSEGPKKKEHICELCGKIIKTRWGMRKHMERKLCRNMDFVNEPGGVFKTFSSYAEALEYFHANDMDKALSSSKSAKLCWYYVCREKSESLYSCKLLSITSVLRFCFILTNTIWISIYKAGCSSNFSKTQHQSSRLPSPHHNPVVFIQQPLRDDRHCHP